MRIVIPNLAPGSDYSLQFRSKNTTQTSPWSRTFVVAAGGDTTPPSTPTGLSLSVAGDSFLAQWNKVTTSSDGSNLTDFAYYNVRVRNVDSGQTAILRADDNKYELTYNLNIALFTPIAGTIAVAVSAVDLNGNASPYTADVTRQNPPPGPVRNLVAVGGIENITSNWEPPENLESDFQEYRLFVVSNPAAVVTNQSTPVWRGQGTSYVYATLTTTPLYIKVAAVDKFNSMSSVVTAGPVSTKSSTEVDIEPPGVPTGLAGSITGTQLKATWVKPVATDLLGYQVGYRKVGATEWSYVTASHDDLTTVISPVELYKNYQIRIRAHDTSFNYSTWSSTVTVNGAVNTAPPAVTGLVVKGAITSAIVTWNRSVATDVVSYEVQFKALSAPLDADPIFTTSANIMGFSENVLTDTMYYARVRPVDDQGLKGPWASASGAVGFVDFGPINERIDDAIISSVVQYSVNASETVPPTTGWSANTPVRTPGSYIWYRTLITYGDNTTNTSNPALLTGNDGAPGTPAPQVSLTASTQALIVPTSGTVTTPATAVVTGTSSNTTISVWQYSVNGAAYNNTVPTGVSRTGNVVTITGSTMTAGTISVRMADANGVADTMTVAKIGSGSPGAPGAPGTPGGDAYTVLLTNESQVIAGNTTSAIAGSFNSTVMAYKGSAPITATVGTITGQVTGLTTAVASNGTASPVITVTVTTALTTKSGELTVPITVDGKVFTKKISWSLSLTGASGIPGVGIVSVTPYYRQVATGATAPVIPTTSPPPAPWTATEPAYAINTELYRTERILYTNDNFTYTAVSKDSNYAGIGEVRVIAITADKRVRKADGPPTLADGADAPIGALWYEYGAATPPATGKALKQTYEWNGSAWQPRGIDSTFLPLVDIGSGTFGDLNGDRMVVNSIGAISIKTEEIAADNAFLNNLVVQTGNIESLEVNKLIGGSGLLADLVVKSELTLGDATNDGVVKSHNFVQGVSGYRLNKNSLEINDGSVSARAIKLQVGQNIVPAAYADFEFAPSWYVGRLFSSANLNTNIKPGGRFGNQYLECRKTTTETSVVHMSPSDTQYLTPVDGGKEYIISAWVRGGTVTSILRLQTRWSTSVYSPSYEVTIAAGSPWSRVSTVVTAPATATACNVIVHSSTATVGAGWDIDGIQLEEKISASNEPSSWTPPSSTSIDGGIIRTGEIRSNDTVNVNGIMQPSWSINMQGNMQIGNALVRGGVVVGQPADGDKSQIQSYNYTPPTVIGGVTLENGTGWMIRSDGFADFRNVRVGKNSIGPDAIDANTLWANTAWLNKAYTTMLTVGSITPEMLAGGEELSVNPTWAKPELRGVTPYNAPLSMFFNSTPSVQYQGSTNVLNISTSSAQTHELRVTADNPVTPGETVYARMVIRKALATNPGTTGFGVTMRIYWLGPTGSVVKTEQFDRKNFETGTLPQTINYKPHDYEFIAPEGASEFYVVIAGPSISHAYYVAQTSVRRGMSSVNTEGNEVVVSPQGVSVYEIQYHEGPGGTIEPVRSLLTRMGTQYEAYEPSTDSRSTMSGEAVSSPVISGDFVLYGGVNLADEMESRPKGIVVNDRGNQLGSTSINELGYREVGFQATAGRAYLLNVWLDANGSTEGTYFVYLRKTQASPPNEAPAPTVDSTEFSRMVIYGAANLTQSGSFIFVPSSDENVRFLISGRGGGTRTMRIRETRFQVFDMGPFTDLADSGRYSNGGVTPVDPGDTPAPPPQTTPPVQTRTKTFTFNTFRTYNNYNSDPSNYVPTNRIRQGRGGNSRYAGLLLMNNADTLEIRGSAIKKIEVYLYHDGPGASGTAQISSHRYTSAPAHSSGTSLNLYNSYHTSGSWGKKSGRWVTLPSSWYSQFAATSNPTRGIAVGSTTGAFSLMDFFGTSTDSAKNPKIRITYTK